MSAKATIYACRDIQYKSVDIRFHYGHANHEKLNLWIVIQNFQYYIFADPRKLDRTRADIIFSPEKWTSDAFSKLLVQSLR